jgi:hypothetical protein
MGMGAGLGRAAGMPPATAGKEACHYRGGSHPWLPYRPASSRVFQAGTIQPELRSAPASDAADDAPVVGFRVRVCELFRPLREGFDAKAGSLAPRIGRTKRPLADCANHCFAGVNERAV